MSGALFDEGVIVAEHVVPGRTVVVHGMPVEFFIPGEAIAKGRGRAVSMHGQVRVFTPAKTRSYENLVKDRASDAMGIRPPIGTPVAVWITVTLPIPQSMPKKHQAAAVDGTLLPGKTPDLDNLAKAISDGMNGIVLVDDKLICDLHARKRYGRVPGVLVRVEVS